MGTVLRNRKQREDVDSSDVSQKSEEHFDDPEVKLRGKSDSKLKPGTFWLTRIVLLRFLSFIYFVAFLVALHQNSGLLGKNGLLPANKYLDDIKDRAGNGILERIERVPTLLWLVDYQNDIDWWMSSFASCGLVLSGFVFINGGSNIFVMLVIWMLYHSIVNVGQRWYSFGWESQLLETGFLAAFLCPLLSLNKFPKQTPTPSIVIWGFLWLIFRIMIGAGLIKIRGDQCWRDLTCMNYHYETQPVPNPISYFMHQEPEFFHKFETLTNHFVELVAPFFFLLGRRMRIIGGFIQVLFQVVLIISGNLSFLNWLTITPSLASFDDASLSWLFPTATRTQVKHIQVEESSGIIPKKSYSHYMRCTLNISLGLLISWLSFPIVQNLMSSRQIMNTSFDSLRIVNTYGAFGSITKERTEVIVQGAYSSDPTSPAAVWEEYEFKCKPGNITRRPCLISPYHYRLDWLMWFAAFQNYQYNPWLVHLVAKLLVNDELATSLIEHNPFYEKDPPKFIRAEHYRYVFTKFNTNSTTWWKRRRIGNYLPPVSLSNLEQTIKSMGWKVPRLPGPKSKLIKSRF